MRTCNQPGCDRRMRAKGLCSTHWQRQAGYIKKPMGDAIEASRGLDWLKWVALESDTPACVNWPFSVGSHGYGALSFRGSVMSAARVTCIMAHGEPVKDQETLHSCVGNRLCVNPKHLRWGTRLENVADAILAGTFRYPSGRAA